MVKLKDIDEVVHFAVVCIEVGEGMYVCVCKCVWVDIEGNH